MTTSFNLPKPHYRRICVMHTLPSNCRLKSTDLNEKDIYFLQLELDRMILNHDCQIKDEGLDMIASCKNNLRLCRFAPLYSRRLINGSLDVKRPPM